MSDTQTLYDQDFVGWVKQQAAALRSAARAGSNLDLDWQNLAEEVEGFGASERRTLHAQLRRVIRHLLTLSFSPAAEPRRSWFETVGDARSEIEFVLEMSPSCLRNEVGAVVEAELGRGSREAIRDVAKYGEIDPATERGLRRSRYTADQILGERFPEEPASASHGDK